MEDWKSKVEVVSLLLFFNWGETRMRNERKDKSNRATDSEDTRI